jgi:hypothetical protein
MGLVVECDFLNSGECQTAWRVLPDQPVSNRSGLRDATGWPPRWQAVTGNPPSLRRRSSGQTGSKLSSNLILASFPDNNIPRCEVPQQASSGASRSPPVPASSRCAWCVGGARVVGGAIRMVGGVWVVCGW